MADISRRALANIVVLEDKEHLQSLDVVRDSQTAVRGRYVARTVRAMRRSASRLVSFATARTNGAPSTPSFRGNACFQLLRSHRRSVDRWHTRWLSSSTSTTFSTDTETSQESLPSQTITFATGLSKRDDLSHAVVEAVAEVKQRLGNYVVPTFIQLMVSADYKNPSLAPKYVMECFTTTTNSIGKQSKESETQNQKVPALFGGTVSGVIGGNGQVMDGYSVSILAAHLPNTEAIPFHSKDASLPSTLTKEQWMIIMRAGLRTDDVNSGSTSKTSTGIATLLLACADFHDVEQLTSRLHAAAPTNVVVGAVAKPGGTLFSGASAVGGGHEEQQEQDDEKHNNSTCTSSGTSDDASDDTEDITSLDPFFLDFNTKNKCTSHGAVGVLLIGSFAIETHSLHSCRPVGPPMTLTACSDDGNVLELDGRSAGSVLQKVLQELPDGVAGMPVMLGVGDDVGVVKDSRINSRNRSTWIRGRVVGNANEQGEDVSAKKEEILVQKTVLVGSKLRTEKREDEKTQDEVSAEAHAARSYSTGGSGYVFRDIVGADHETGGVFVGQHSLLREGSTCQLHVRDSGWGKLRVKELLRSLSDPKNEKKILPTKQPVGAVMYTCVSGNRMHAGDFRTAVAGCPLAGGYVAGEIGPAGKGQRSSLQSHTSVVAVFRER